MKIYKQKILLIFLTLCIHAGIIAQEWFPANGFLYDPTNVARVDIDIDQDSLDFILHPDNENSYYEFPAVFTFKRGATQSTIDSIGFRLRGNTSRRSAKKSFKVSLNTFIPGQKYHGVEKINLNGEHNDPSISRSHICWELYRRAGVPASRSGFAELYINNEYMGLYINVEHIDEEFVKLRFGNNDGNLYKCLWPADLTYIGSDPDDYKFESGSRQAYALKNNLLENDYSDLATLIKILDQTDPDDFPELLEPVFNVNTYLKSHVVEVLSGHWDAYSYNQNNFYLYNNEITGKFEFIPYDLDNTLGIAWNETDWTERDIYNWSSGDKPLTKKILQNDIYRDRFSFFMNRFLETEFNSSSLDPFINQVRTRIKTYAESDLYRTYSYDFTYSDFYDSFDEAWGDHVREGIIPFISKRNTSALQQVETVNIAPAITIARISKRADEEILKISALVEDENTVSDVKAFFSENEVDYTEVSMEQGEGDIFASSFQSTGVSEFISFYIEATDQQLQTSREPPFGAYRVNLGLVSKRVSVSSQQTLNIYPNPAESFIHVNSTLQDQSCSYILYNMNGQELMRGNPASSNFTIQLDSGLPGGVYILEVSGSIKSSAISIARKKIILK